MNGRTLGTWGCRKSINVAFFLFLAKICGELGNKWDFIFPFSWLDTMRAKNRAVIAVHRKRWTSAQKQRCEETVSGKRLGIDNRDMLRCQFWHRKTFQIRHTILRKPDPHRSRFIQKKIWFGGWSRWWISDITYQACAWQLFEAGHVTRSRNFRLCVFLEGNLTSMVLPFRRHLLTSTTFSNKIKYNLHDIYSSLSNLYITHASTRSGGSSTFYLPFFFSFFLSHFHSSFCELYCVGFEKLEAFRIRSI